MEITCISKPLEEYSLSINFLNSQGLDDKINFGPCEYGRNLDIKLKSVINEIKSFDSEILNDFVCLNFKNSDSILYNIPTFFNF